MIPRLWCNMHNTVGVTLHGHINSTALSVDKFILLICQYLSACCVSFHQLHCCVISKKFEIGSWGDAMFCHLRQVLKVRLTIRFLLGWSRRDVDLHHRRRTPQKRANVFESARLVCSRPVLRGLQQCNGLYYWCLALLYDCASGLRIRKALVVQRSWWLRARF